MSMNVQDVVKAIDWEQLLKQKMWLLEQEDCDESNGLISLLDAIQDAAVDSGLVSFNEVFGDDDELDYDTVEILLDNDIK